MKVYLGQALAAAILVMAPAWPNSSGEAAGVRTHALEGEWRVVIMQSRNKCVWRGTITLRHRDGAITGKGQAKPSKRAKRCPELKGSVNGRINGNRVRFGFATGRLGNANFEGDLSRKFGTMDGRWSAPKAGGEWRAYQQMR